MTVNLAGLTNSTFLNGQAVPVLTASPTGFTAHTALGDYTTVSEPITATAEVTSFQIPLAQVISLEPQVGTDAGLVTPTLQSGYYLSGGNYALGTAPINTAGAGIGESWNPSSPVFQGQIVVDINGNTQLALNAGTTGPQSPTDLASPPNPWSAELNGLTADNDVVWRNIGKDVFSDPRTWLGVLNLNAPLGPNDFAFTGEVGNWSLNYAYGLVAPRLSQTWEIISDEDFIFGLF